MAASKLESEGIQVFIEDHPRRGGAVRPARIKVFADDAAAAVAILPRGPHHLIVGVGPGYFHFPVKEAVD